MAWMEECWREKHRRHLSQLRVVLYIWFHFTARRVARRLKVSEAAGPRPPVEAMTSEVKE